MILKIDALSLLLLIELSLVLLGATVFLLFRARKYKELYRKGVEGAGGGQRTAPLPQEVPDGPGEKEEVLTGQTVQEAAALPEQEGFRTAEEDDSRSGLQGEISKLQRIVDYQKGRILDLMCYKDIFESAQKRLASIQQKYQELQEKIEGLVASSGENQEGLAVMTGILQDNNRELASYIGVLSGENTVLSEKFVRWEKELRIFWEEAGTVSGAGAGAGSGKGGAIDEERYEEILREKEELMDKVKGFEGKLEEKSRLLEEMQKQYEDMEKEYMILYNQQQAAQQQL